MKQFNLSLMSETEIIRGQN